ncbi:MAG TPA: efflux RND transporter periplasmic adaptor subunit [Bryobacteraceae bacterium]|nr:efflux RND transporter periplasmic adaptor subunit [Bryobacteraceae bacterium]
MKKIIFRLVVVLLVASGAWYGYRFFQQMPQRQERVAVAKVRRGDVVIRAFSRGELRAVRSVTLTAPNLFGTVQVTRLAPVGSFAKEKDLIVEFDDSERRAALEETLLEVEQIDEQIKKAKADLAIRDNQDQVDLLRTRYNVRRAELEVKRNELISAIDAKRNLLTLEEQKRRLKQLESDIESRKQQGLASLAVLQEQRNKSMIDVRREEQRIAQAKVLSPIAGLVAIRQNRSGFFMFGQQVPDIREGDTVQPGMMMADVLDLSELEVIAKVGELDRANLHEGQEVMISLDAIADKRFKGKIKGMSGTASANVFSGDPAKKFDVIFSIDMRELLKALNVKPAEIEKIVATAERNAKKAPPTPAMGMLSMMGGMPGGMPGGAMPGGGMQPGGIQPGGMPGGAVMGGPGGEGGSEAGQARGMRRGGGEGGGGMRMGANLSEEDQKKFRAAMEKALGGRSPRDLSPEERTKIFGELRAKFAGGDAKKGDAKKGDTKQADAMGQTGPARLGRPGGGGMPGGNPLDMLRFTAMSGGFTEQERANARLPMPPEEDSELQVLLRPGLLADVEITVEKIPNALHVPAQAVFEKDGKPMVWVQTKGGRFEERQVQLVKRSESVMVLAGGVQAGETIAMADPYQSKGAKGKKGEKKSGGNAMGAMPAGGSK